MLVTRSELQCIINEQLSSGVAGEIAQLKSREESMLSSWQEEGVVDTLGFEAWMTALVVELQGSIEGDEVLKRAYGHLLNMPPDAEETWQSLSSVSGEAVNYYDLWLNAKGSQGAISDIVYGNLAPDMMGDATDAIMSMYSF